MRSPSIVIAVVAVGLVLAPVAASQSVRRDVPHHDPSLVAGCTGTQLALVVERLSAAIDVGAPLYNDGDHAGCYHTYEQAARALEGALSNACSGPSRALREGRTRAAGLTSDTARAWAMRDAFDGLLLLLMQLGVR